MKHDIILAGVGGQGILTIAKAISSVALDRSLNIKQAEVHGMSQRGGTVQSHLRISDREVLSDLVKVGCADLLIAVEPLEALRYTDFVSPTGALVASVNAFVNVGNYPAVEEMLSRIAARPRHVLIDAERVARAAGSGRAANIAMLGAASLYLDFDPNELEESVARAFAKSGDKVVSVNRRAFRFGRSAANAYLDGLGRGGSSAAVRHWIDTLGPEHLAEPERPDAPVFDVTTPLDELSGAESHAVERTLWQVYEEGRKQLFEHEVYSIVQLVGAISPPHHVFVPVEALLSAEALLQFPGDRVALKLVSPDVVHKTDADGIAFVSKDHDTVLREIDRMVSRHQSTADVRGVLVVEYVERGSQAGFGNELFVGIRATREFGPVIAAGLGGIDTEYLARKMKPGIAVAKAVASETTAEEFFELFKATAAYEILAGQARGRQRVVSDGELLRCFRSFIFLAQRFCVDRKDEGPDVAELEVNPFAFRRQGMVPLDGRGTLGTAAHASVARPLSGVSRMLEPKSMAIVGVSAGSMNFARIVLGNVLKTGFPREHLYVIKRDADQIDGVRCVPTVADLPEPIDLMVYSAPASYLPTLIDEAVAAGKVGSIIFIPGGVGETDGTEKITGQVKAAIARARQVEGGPVFLGPNCLGVVSRPGRYDTFFIPDNKTDKRASAPGRPVALLSQSGAFIVSRMNNLETLDPTIAVSFGNQYDITVSDLLRVVGGRDDINVVGVYAEGFSDLDGREFLRAVSELRDRRTDVVFYKAGRTEQGRSAAAGHTAAVAGDYDICQAAADQAGALVADTFKEFEQLLELCTALHDKKVRGVRVGVISNAGFETVGMADAIKGQRYQVELGELSADSAGRLARVLEANRLGGLVNPRNPLDLTPMAGEGAYAGAVESMVSCDEIDALVVGCVPLTAALKTTKEEMEEGGSLAELVPKLFAATDKPCVVVVDSGPRYEPMVRKLREAGVPVFRSADQAIRSVGRYLCHRVHEDRIPSEQ
jgi:indolepyruvate ferredoxin oxidoreductase beta subunit